MKAAAIFALAVCAVSLTGCTWSDDVAEPGNPSQTAYAGTPGSAYDVAANPPKDIGQVTYDPNQPLPNNLPADATLPPPATSGNAVTMAPLGAGATGARTPVR